MVLPWSWTPQWKLWGCWWTISSLCLNRKTQYLGRHNIWRAGALVLSKLDHRRKLFHAGSHLRANFTSISHVHVRFGSLRCLLYVNCNDNKKSDPIHESVPSGQLFQPKANWTIWYFTKVLQLRWRIPLQDSRSFGRDPSHLTLHHGFPIIRLSERKFSERKPEEIA